VQVILALYLLLAFFLAQTGYNFVLCSKTSEKQFCMVVLYKPILQQLVDFIENQFDCSFTVQIVCSFLILGRHKFQLFAGFSIWSNGPIFWRYNFIIYKCQPYFMLELSNMDILLSKWFLSSCSRKCFILAIVPAFKWLLQLNLASKQPGFKARFNIHMRVFSGFISWCENSWSGGELCRSTCLQKMIVRLGVWSDNRIQCHRLHL
jgi:hypothetical protein